MANELLQINDLKVSFYTEAGKVEALDGISFSVKKGETLGIVGESGCGKSVTSLSVMGLIASPPGKIEGGEILFEGKNLLNASAAEMRGIRGNDISMIFQEPMTSLNPVFTIGFQLGEVLQVHKGLKDKDQIEKECIELLKRVGVPRAERVVKDYPFALSGGMRQRAMIAMALACDPKLLIADEPTTALDVTIQAQILQIMRNLQAHTDMSIMFITHDLGVIAEMSDRVVVMYAGHIVEQADVENIFKNPLHPYTRGLLDSKPSLHLGEDRLHVIKGMVPNLLARPKGCQFNPRCEIACERGERELPPLTTLEDGRQVRCFVTAEQLLREKEVSHG